MKKRDSSNQEHSEKAQNVPPGISRQMLDEAVKSGIFQADQLMEIIGNIVAKRLEDGFNSGIFHQKISQRLKNFFLERFVLYLPHQEQQEEKVQEIEAKKVLTEDDLTHFLDSLIKARMELKIEEEAQFVRTEQERQALEKEKERRNKKKNQERMESLNHWSFGFLLVVGSFALGIHVGLNLLPSGVLCERSFSPCYWFRFDGKKMTIYKD